MVQVVGTLVVNPGQLSRGSGGGTYAEISIHPIRADELRDAVLQGKDAVPHAICSRSSVTIQRI